jgi:inorganic pyrophosphatase
MTKIPDPYRQISPNPWHDVSPGEQSSQGIVQSIIEIPMGSSNKYELDKETGLLKLDRVLYSAVYYPANYGFIPQTLADDGDPLDVLVLGAEPVYPLTLVKTRIIGLMVMKDQDELDHKLIGVPVGDPEYRNCNDVHELPAHRLAVLKRFFEDYKTLEEKSVIVDDILPAKEALPVIEESIATYRTWRAGGEVILNQPREFPRG